MGLFHVRQKPFRSFWNVVKIAFMAVKAFVLVSTAYKALAAPQDLPTFIGRTETQATDLTPVLAWYVKEIFGRIFLG